MTGSGDVPTLVVHDGHGRQLLCFLEQLIPLDGNDYALLTPVDTPVCLFRLRDDEEDPEVWAVGFCFLYSQSVFCFFVFLQLFPVRRRERARAPELPDALFTAEELAPRRADASEDEEDLPAAGYRG
jgi:hypothetical protein